MVERVNNKSEKVLEDIYPETGEVLKLKEILKHWEGTHNYNGADWTGTERLYFWIASFTDKVAIETTGWFRYQNSLKLLDGKNWRLVIPHKGKERKAIVIDINSLVHDSVHTLSTTIYSTNDINLQNLKWIGHKDHFKRVMFWLIEEATLLSQNGMDFSDEINNFKQRIQMANTLTSLKNEVIPELSHHYKKITGLEAIIPPISMSVNDWYIRDGSIASIKFLGEHLDWCVITVAPRAWTKGLSYLRQVVIHELIHAVLGKQSNGHNQLFNQLAIAMGLPKKYRD